MNETPTRKICFVTTLPVTLRTFVQPQAERLLQQGWEVTWICAQDDRFAATIPAGVRYLPMPFKRGLDFWAIPWYIWTLAGIFRREQFDIVQYSTPNAAFYASIASRLARRPVRLYAQWGIRYVGFDGLKRRFFKFLEKITCHCSTVVEPDSRSNLEFAVSEGLYVRSKGRVIWNGSASGVNLQRFDIAQKGSWRQEYRQKLGLDDSHLVVGFVGSIRRDKGCSELLAAVRSLIPQFPGLRLLLVGDKHFYDSIETGLREWADASPQVIHVPPTSEVPQYMACMDLFALPSYREGFGSVVVEAEAMGLPVVVSNVPGPIDAMRDGETGLVVPVKNAEALGVALRSLLEDSGQRQRFGLAAREFASTHFEQSRYYELVLADKDDLLQRCR